METRAPEQSRRYTATWKARDPEAYRLSKSRYREKHPEKVRAIRRAYYLANKERYGVLNSANRRRNREITDAAKSRPCMDCGGTFPPYVMDFDHRDRSIKHASVGTMRGTAVEKLLAEIAKCDVVCSNCHRLRTYRTIWNSQATEVA